MALWRIALDGGPGGKEERLQDIDWCWLADNLILTGADIKATAQAAAFLARSQDSHIRMEQLLHAAKREMAKRGSSWRVPEWSVKRNG
jgi:hypothetical protein